MPATKKPEVFTKNSKTILSVDFDRRGTCVQWCEYCYVDNMERIYTAYLTKIQKNNSWVSEDPKGFAAQLGNEYRKARRSKAKGMKGLDKMPVRIYGSGDYIPKHYDFLSELDFKFYLISKNLTMPDFAEERQKVHDIENCTNILLSFDNENIKHYDAISHLRKQDRYRFCFTGSTEDWLLQTEFNRRRFDIFFNIGKKKVDIEFNEKDSKACPALAKRIPHDKACATCNKCWASSATRGKHWNSI